MKMFSAKTILKLVFISLIPPFLLIIPFWRGWSHFYYLDLVKQSGIFNLFSNWDGPHYILIARSLYDQQILGARLFMQLPIEYYFNHFPLYPILIRLLSTVAGWGWSGIFVNLFFSTISNFVFFFWVRRKTAHPFWLTLTFTLLPPRMYPIRAIIAPEFLMLALMMLCLIFANRKKYFLAGIFGMLATLTKFQAIVLVPALILAFLHQQMFPNQSFIELIQKLFSLTKLKLNYLVRGLIKSTKLILSSTEFKYVVGCGILIFSGYLIVTTFYFSKTGSWWTYFASQKVNNLTAGLPFAQFDYHSPWSGTGWMEELVFYFLMMILLIQRYAQKKVNQIYFYFICFYSLMLVLVPQRDITRLSLPLVPFFMLTFERFFSSKTFRLALVLIFPALYMYSLNFLMHNQAPVADWSLILF